MEIVLTSTVTTANFSGVWMEGWLSGLKLQFTKLPRRLRLRGFESLSFRQIFPNQSYVAIGKELRITSHAKNK